MEFTAKTLGRREIGIAVAASLAVGLLWVLGWATALERPGWDLLMRVPRPGSTPDAGMAAVVVDDASVAEYGSLPWPRSRLASVVHRIRAAGARAVVVDILLAEKSDAIQDAELTAALSAGPVAAAAVLSSDGSWILPAEEFGGVEIAAHAHADVASDGVLRGVSSTKQANGLSLPALSLAAARLAGWEGAVQPGEFLLSDYRTPPDSIPSLNAVDVLMARDETALLKSRVVFLGVSASGVGDQFFVPVGARNRPIPGVLVHASFASSITRGGMLSVMPAWALVIGFFVIAIAMQLVRSRAGSLRLSSLLAVVMAVPVVALLSLWVGGILLPSIGLLSTAVVSVVFREVIESRGARRETDMILQSLVDLEAAGEASEKAHGVQERLRRAQLLQEKLICDRNLRRTLLEGLAEGVVLWDENGTPLLHNAAIEELWGHVPDYGEVVEDTGCDSGEPDGNLVVVRFGRAVEVFHRSVGEGRLALMRDVSERRELERHRRDMQRLVSHELKTPLASIAGFGAMLERYSLTDEELARTAGMIRGEAERLGEMVKRFLDLERLGSGHWEQQTADVDLSELITKRCGVLAASADRKNIGIVVRASVPAWLMGVGQLLEQLVDNLVGNAVKYCPEGSKVTVEVRAVGNTTVLEVADNGPGIPKDAIDHIFERFYRGPDISVPGTGLGLALVKEVAVFHGADVTVTSEMGRGSSFAVVFPRQEE